MLPIACVLVCAECSFGESDILAVEFGVRTDGLPSFPCVGNTVPAQTRHC